jgi:polyhydroxybutyrate depolymerase
VTTRRSLAGALVLATALAACGAGAATQDKTATAQAQAACPSAGRHAVDGGVLRIPPGAKPGATPLLVVVIPGGGDDPRDHLRLAKPADAAHMALLYPTRKGETFWQLNDEQGTSDVTNVSDTLDAVLSGGCFDTKRVSIIGVSNGSGFATRMACERPDRFAAVIPVAAGYRALDPCPAGARAWFLDIHGTSDTVVPYNGKAPDFKGNVPRFTARWARRDGCSTRPRATRPTRLVTHFTYRGCDGARRVEAFRLTGTQHGWPGSTGPFTRANPSRFKAAPTVVRFALAARLTR